MTRQFLPLGALATCAALMFSPVQAQPNTPLLEPILIASNQTVTTETKTDTKAENTPRQRPDRSDWISLQDALTALEKAGHTDLHGIHMSRDGYVAKAINQDQKRVLLRVDPKTSAVSESEMKSKKRGKHKHQRGSSNQS